LQYRQKIAEKNDTIAFREEWSLLVLSKPIITAVKGLTKAIICLFTRPEMDFLEGRLFSNQSELFIKLSKSS